MPSSPLRQAWRDGLRELFLADSTAAPASTPLDPAGVMTWLRDALPDDAIVTFDAGAFSGWPQRFLSFGRPGRVLAP